MTSSGLDDFFIPGEDDEQQQPTPPPSESETTEAPRDSHVPAVPGPPGPLAAPAAVDRTPESQAEPPAPTPASQRMPSGATPAPAPPGAGIPAPSHAGVTPPTQTPDRQQDSPPGPRAVPSAPFVGTPRVSASGAPAGATPSTTPSGAPAAPPTVAPPPAAPAPSAPTRPIRTREEQLQAALATFMRVSSDVEAAALVSLDGFTMASALPAGMQEDRVGAMSAAILGLGERAAIELGRGRLSQVFIEGDTGYVLLMAAGDRAVLTALARLEAKLGLLLYDMRDVAEAIADILG